MVVYYCTDNSQKIEFAVYRNAVNAKRFCANAKRSGGINLHYYSLKVQDQEGPVTKDLRIARLEQAIGNASDKMQAMKRTIDERECDESARIIRSTNIAISDCQMILARERMAAKEQDRAARYDGH
jgi:hypothetical protein